MNGMNRIKQEAYPSGEFFISTYITIYFFFALQITLAKRFYLGHTHTHAHTSIRSISRVWQIREIN